MHLQKRVSRISARIYFASSSEIKWALNSSILVDANMTFGPNELRAFWTGKAFESKLGSSEKVKDAIFS